MNFRALTLAVVAASAIGAGCKKDEAAPAGPERFDATVTLDIRAEGQLHVEEHAARDGATDVSLALKNGFDLFDPSAPFTAAGRIEAFPEAGLRMYTAHFSRPGRAGGPCGDRALALELALTRRLDNARLSGALTVYCDGAVGLAAPVRVLRVASR